MLKFKTINYYRVHNNKIYLEIKKLQNNLSKKQKDNNSQNRVYLVDFKLNINQHLYLARI